MLELIVFFDILSHDQSLPDPWETVLTPFQKLILIKFFRPDALPTALSHFVDNTLGKKILDHPHDLESAFQSSSPTVPLLFILSNGVDPTSYP
jgi:dynein heavy chain